MATTVWIYGNDDRQPTKRADRIDIRPNGEWGKAVWVYGDDLMGGGAVWVYGTGGGVYGYSGEGEQAV